MPVPEHPRIRHLGFLDDEDKFDAIAAADAADHAVVLREPVDGGARGVGAGPAGARQRPLRRAARASASAAAPGCTTRRYEEFVETLYALESNGPLQRGSGATDASTFERHYAWPVIERKYLDMFDRLKRGAGAQPNVRSSRCPAGCAGAARDRARRGRGALRHSVRCGHRASARPDLSSRHDAPDSTRARVHQVLATLGYGDAIGHEVLGIQRVLRAAGYESEIFVETADPRLEAADRRLPRPGRQRRPHRTS